MRLPSLHKGYWIFQSPRILIILTYLKTIKASLEDTINIIKTHIDHVSKLVKSYEKRWILERLNRLGYEPKSRAKDVSEILQQEGIIDYYLTKLGICQSAREKIASSVREILTILRVRDLKRSVAYLPPELTVIEKLLLLDALSRSESFDLKTSLEVVIRSWLTGKRPLEILEGDRHSSAREFRFRYSYLMCLGSIAGDKDKPRPTSLGLTIYEATNIGVNPATCYVKNLMETGRLEHAISIDVSSLDIMDKNMLDKYIDLVSKIIREYLNETRDLIEQVKYKLTSLVSYLPSDSKNVTVVLMTKDVYNILKTLEI